MQDTESARGLRLCVTPDLPNIVPEYAQPTAEAQLTAAVIAEAQLRRMRVPRQRTDRYNFRFARQVRPRLA